MRTREELLAERASIDSELQCLDRREILQEALGNIGALVDALDADEKLEHELVFQQCVTSPTKDGECRVFPVSVSVDRAKHPDSGVVKLQLEIYY